MSACPRTFGRLGPSKEKYRSFREGPLQMHVADLFAGASISFSCGLFGALDQPGIGDKVLDCGEAFDIVDLVEDDQSQDLADAVHRAQPVEYVDVVYLGRLSDVELDLGEQLIVVIDEREVHLDGLTHA